MERFCPGPPGGAHPLGVKVVQTGAKLPIVQTFSYRRILMLGNGVMSLVLTNMGTFVKRFLNIKVLLMLLISSIRFKLVEVNIVINAPHREFWWEPYPTEMYRLCI